MTAVVLGGTFNPVHYGHLFVAEEVRSALGYEVAIFIPSNLPVHKDPSPVLPPDHRLDWPIFLPQQELVSLAATNSSRLNCQPGQLLGFRRRLRSSRWKILVAWT